MDNLAIRRVCGLVFDEFEERLAKAHALPILVIGEGRDHMIGTLHVHRAPYCPVPAELAALLRRMAADLEGGRVEPPLDIVVPVRRDLPTG